MIECEYCSGSGIDPHYNDTAYPRDLDDYPKRPPPCRECGGHGFVRDPGEIDGWVGDCRGE